MKVYFGVSYAKSNLGKAMLTGLTEMATKYHFTMSYNSFISDIAEDSLEDAAMDLPLTCHSTPFRKRSGKMSKAS